MSTTMAKINDIQRKWYIIDAADNVLGRLSTTVSRILMGKHLVNYTQNVDMGDFVIIINADKIKLTGNKLTQKIYYKHSGWVGGLKEKTYKKLMDENKSNFIISKAIKGMLPKNTIGHQAMTRVKIFNNANHKHQAQKPIIWTLDIK